MADLDFSINWAIEHWYYWALIIITLVLFNLYMQFKRLKNMYSHWTDDRLKEKTKTETKANPPPISFKWLIKHRGGKKFKRIGKITSYKAIPENPDGIQITVTAETRIIPYTKISLGDKKIFRFNDKEVKKDLDKKAIIIPYEYYWDLHPTGEFVLMCPDAHKTWKIVGKEIDRDLKKLAIDGFASQMASYSAVRPTWGHEADIVDREGQAKFGFLEKFKGKGKSKDKED